MFDAQTPSSHTITGFEPTPLPVRKVERPEKIAEVFAYFRRGEGPMPRWLRPFVDVGTPTEEELHRAAEAWARHDPRYLDDLMLYPYQCPEPTSAMCIAAEIAGVARYRVDNKLTGEPWAATRGRLEVSLRD